MWERGTADVSSLKVMNIYLVAHPQLVLIFKLRELQSWTLFVSFSSSRENLQLLRMTLFNNS